MKSTLEILKEARELLSDENRWERFAAARTADGEVCLANDKRAVAFCSMGAVMRASDDSACRAEANALIELNVSAQTFGCKSLVGLNAAADHATVLQMFDMTIARLSAELDEQVLNDET